MKNKEINKEMNKTIEVIKNTNNFEGILYGVMNNPTAEYYLKNPKEFKEEFKEIFDEIKEHFRVAAIHILETEKLVCNYIIEKEKSDK